MATLREIIQAALASRLNDESGALAALHTHAISGVTGLQSALNARTTVVAKTDDQTRNATTTLADDSVLLFPIAANTKYWFRLTAWFDTPILAGFKYQIAGPALPTLVRTLHRHIVPGGVALAGLLVNTALSAVASITAAATDGGALEVVGTIHNGANAGNLSLQWAQVTSDGSNTTLRAGSVLEYLTI